MTSTISAADNLVIDYGATKWQLRFSNEDLPLATADANGFRYSDGFSLTHRLPTSGVLTNTDIAQVVLGWQKSDESWHLGFVLSPENASVRNSRWCQLAHWPDPDQEVFNDLAREVGDTLSSILNVPFNFIPPEAVQPPPPPRELPPLPLKFGYWSLQGAGTYHGVEVPSGELAFVRSAAWVTQKYRRIGWYLFWTVIYFFVSFLTLTSPIGLPNAGTLLPNPHILPYLGLITGFGLIFLSIYNAYLIASEVRVIRVSSQGLSGWHQTHKHWELNSLNAQSVYISEIIKKRERANTTEHGELNLHMGGGKFHYVLQQEVPVHNDESLLPPDFSRPKYEHVQPLVRAGYFTDLQAAALYVSELLRLTAWYDVRVK